MAWIPTWECGFETQDPTEAVLDPTASGTESLVFINTFVRTGAFARNLARATLGGHGVVLDAPVTRVRAGVAYRHIPFAGSSTTLGPILLYCGPRASARVLLWFIAGLSEIQLVVNGAVVDTISFVAAGLTSEVYHDFGLQANLVNDATGFATIYRDGSPILSYTGAIAGGATSEFYFGDRGGAGNTFAINSRMDDIYLDVADGAEPDVAPSTFRIAYTTVNGAGDSSQWTPEGAANNWDAVNDGVPDGDTTHVRADAADLLDLYTVSGITVPADYSPVGVRPIYTARKTTSETDSRFAGVIKDGATQAVDATEHFLPTDHAVIRGEYRAARPGGGAWTEAAINALQIGQMSKGAF